MRSTPDFDWMVLTPGGFPDPSLAIAGSRAGALGVLNLEFHDEPRPALEALARLASLARGRSGVLLDGSAHTLLNTILEHPRPGLEVIVFASAPEDLTRLVRLVHRGGLKVLLIATSLEEGLAGEQAGVDAIIAKGNEAGGWVGEETTFVLLQRLIPRLRIPVWAMGGIGPSTAGACRVAGALGAVMDSQLLLTKESPVPQRLKARLGVMDGSETICLGSPFGAAFRAYSRPDLASSAELKRLEATALLADRPAEAVRHAWKTAIRHRVDWREPESSVIALGQDAAFAVGLASRYVTVGGVLAAMREAVAASATGWDPGALAEGSPLARSHGTKYPIVQGPMTRVSDHAEFAAAVAEAGALPFLALALMRGPEAKTLLEETRRLLGDRPWGVGVLGFVPQELRAEQLEVVRAYKPPFALIAGGRPDQSRILEREGISTYLHVPSPGLLRMFLKEGARRFVFEGRECGGHVGPRTSFVLWESMIEVLSEQVPSNVDPTEYHILFAGGVHDGLSAAMVAALATPLTRRGIRVGVLIGTAYLFTREAVSTGAIVDGFQRAALECDRTVLLESGPGHATRCVQTPFVADFAGEKRRMIGEGIAAEELRHSLEALNIGRLRVASKGLDHNPQYGRDPAAPKLAALGSEEQWTRGMYMIGQVAGLRKELCTLAELHEEVSTGVAQRLSTTSVVASDEDRHAPAPAAVAIVGMACIVPGAPDLATFWSNILNKVDAITEVPADRWDWRQYFDPSRSARDKIYSRWGGFIGDVPFDPMTFGMPPSSLRSIEPFQLLALAVVRSALEDAGYLNRPFPRERTSVVLGAGGGGADLTAGYMVRSTLPSLINGDATALVERLGDRLPEWTEDSFPGVLMNVAAGRVANRFDLGGVNYTVDAACASSLAAMYLAVRDLEARTSDVAIVGGIDAIQNPFAFMCFSKTQALSPNGRCRTFDAGGDGIAISEGFAAVILKRLEDAERDGDRIYAVIRGAGGSSDGRDRSMTAPRPEGQVRALRRAYAQAGYSPATVGLVEAHGTGTAAGDQAEIKALATFFGEQDAPKQGCAVGSIKSMIGHTKATAGVAGLIKAALALKHRVLPPTLNVSRPHPKANFPESPFYVNTEPRPWIHGESKEPRRAGVSAFGFGGTNFHIALEEYTGSFLAEQPAARDPWPAELFLWRSRSRDALLEGIGRLVAALQSDSPPRPADLACALARAAESAPPDGPSLAIVTSTIEDLVQKLGLAESAIRSGVERKHESRGIHYAERPLAAEGRIAFIFPGQGSQYINMTRDLAVAFPEVRECFERADSVLAAELGRPLSRWIFPPPTFSEDEEKPLQEALTETNIAQPALAAADVGVLRLLDRMGIKPEMAAGHSFGEFVALHAAGCFGECELLEIAAARGRFIRECTTEESGSMAAVVASPGELTPLLEEVPGITQANVNAPKQTVIAGSRAAVDRAIEWCGSRGLQARRLPVACAFHSPLIAPAQRKLAELIRRMPIAPACIPVYSNTTASPYPNDPAGVAAQLAEHLVRPVEFVREVQAMYDAGARLFVEVGPRQVLAGLIGQILGDRPHVCASFDRPREDGLTALLHGLAALAAEGAKVRAEGLFQGRSIRAVDLSQPSGEGETTHSPTTWLVNGGRARPIPRKTAGGGSKSKPPKSDASSGVSPTITPQIDRSVPQRPPTHAGRPAERVGRQIHQTPLTDSPPAAVPSALTGPRGDVPNGDGATRSRSGDYARPLVSQRSEDEGGPMNRPTVQNSRFNGTASPPYPAGAQSQEQPTAPPRVSPTPDGNGPIDLARQFQQVMTRFLQTQENVMHDLLTCLSSPGTLPAAPAGDTATSLPWHGPTTARGESFAHEPVTQPLFVATPRALVEEAPPVSSPSAVAASPPTAVVFTTPPALTPSTPMPAAPIATEALRTGPVHANGVDHAASPKPAAASIAEGAPDRGRITEQLLAIVSERTGYPEEMLDLEADLEADLGIDSIKRVEIAGTLVRALDLPEGRTPDIEKLTGSRSLRQVIDHLEAFIGESGGPGEAKEDRRPFDDARTGHGVGRFALRIIEAPPISAKAGLAPDGLVVIVDDEAGVGRRLARALSDQGRRVLRLVSRIESQAGESDAVSADLTDPEAVARLVAGLRDRMGPPAALIHLPALRAVSIGDRPDHLKSLYLLARALAPDLEGAASRGGAAILAATSLGGSFAVGAATLDVAPEDGSLAGFLKSLSHECPTIRIKVVDLPPTDVNTVVGWLLAELAADDHLVEVGYLEGRRTTLELVSATLPIGNAALPLEVESVVLVTGGARGITARAVLSLAEAVPCRFVLVGRTPPPTASEPAETTGIEEPRALKRAILGRLQAAGEPVSVPIVEDRCRRLLLEREVRANLERIRQTGAMVEYVACDVSDPSAFGTLIDDLYRVHGRIDGVIHGAGIIEDRLVRDKTPESFDRVVKAKAGSATVLAEKLRLDALRFLVFFSSVSGRFGNRGQADYAAASEVLNKLAQVLDRQCSGRIVSINWGPWLETGMVSPEVQRQFTERGVVLIPPNVGCRMMVDELRIGRKGDVEILIGGSQGFASLVHESSKSYTHSTPSAEGKSEDSSSHAKISPLIAVAGTFSRIDGQVELVRTINPAIDRYLEDHCLDGRPVFPFAMAMELMAEAAQAGWPDLDLLEITEIRLQRGVVIDDRHEAVRVIAHDLGGADGAADPSGADRTLDVSIQGTGSPQRVHYRATVRLGRRAAERPAFIPEPGLLVGQEIKVPGVQEAYRDLLFHGPIFQGIVSIEAIGPRGARAILRTSSPRDCLRGRPDGSWLVDPILVDSALQMQVLWARLHWDVTLLPARIGGCRLFGPGIAAPPRTIGGQGAPGICYELRIGAESRVPTCHADHYFSSPDGRLLGMLAGVEGTGSKALNRLAGTSGR